MRRALPWSVILPAGFAGCAFLLLLHDVAMPPNAALPPAADIAPTLPALSPLRAPPPADPRIYDDIAARPVFLPTRRPPPPIAAASPAAAAPPLTFTLVGVIRAPGQKFGVIRQDGDPDAIMVRQGESIGGWTLTAVGDSSITLAWQGIVETLKIMP